MADFRAKILAELDTSKISKDIAQIGNEKISLKNITLDTKTLTNQIQQALSGHKFTLNLGNVQIGNLSKNVTGQMKTAGSQAGQVFSQSLIERINSKIAGGGIDSAVARVTAQYEKLGSTGHAKLDVIKQDISSLNQLQLALANSKDASSLTANYAKFNETLAKVKNGLKTVSSESKIFASSLQINSLDNKIANWMHKNTAASRSYGESLSSLRSKLHEMGDSGQTAASELKAVENEFKRIRTEAALAGKTGNTFGTTFKNALGSISRYVSSATIIYSTINSFKQMAQNVLEVDTAMTGLYRVTDLTATQYDALYQKMTRSAKGYGATLTDIINSTSDWVRLGFDADTSERLAEITTMYQHVTDLDNTTATKNLVTAYKGFQEQLLEYSNGDQAKAATYIADIYDKLGNEFSVTAQGVGESMTKCASSLNMAGNSIQEATAMATGIAEVTQDYEKTGSTLNVLSLRLRGMKGELLDLGEEVDDNVESVSKMQTQILNLTHGKVNIFNDDKSFKSTYEIMKEISSIYDKLSDVDRANLLETIAGKNRANSVSALISNWQQVENAMQAATNAEGTAAAENEKYMQSLQGKLDTFKASFQALSATIIKSDFLKGLVSGGTGVLNILDKVINKIGTIPLLITALHSARVWKSSDSFFEGFSKSAKGLKTYTAGLIKAKAATVGLRVVSTALAGALALVATSFISWGISKVTQQINAAKEARESIISADEEAAQSSDELYSLTSSYLDASEAMKDGAIASDEMAQIQNDVISALGLTGESIDILTQKYGSLQEAIIATAQEQVKTKISEVTGAAQAAKEKAQDELETKKGTQIASDEQEIVEYLSQKGYGEVYQWGSKYILNPPNDDSWQYGDISFSNLMENYKHYEDVMNDVREAFGSNNETFKQAQKNYNAYAKFLDPAIEKINAANETIAKSLVLSEEQLGSPETMEEYIAVRKRLINQLEVDKDFDTSTGGTADSVIDHVLSQTKIFSEFAKEYSDFGNLSRIQIEDALNSLSDGGEVNLTLRPVIDTSLLKEAGWSDAGDGTATVFSSTFSNSDGNIAMNFTPIIADEDGNCVSVLSPDELQKYAEEVIDGVHDDYLKIKIGSTFSGKDAIEQAEAVAEKIHKLHEIYYDDDYASSNGAIVLSLSEISEKAKTAGEITQELAKNIKDVTSIVTSQSEGKSISLDDFNSEKLADYRQALEYTNGAMHLNAERVNEIVKAKAEEQIAVNNSNKAMAQSKYLENAREIENLRKKLAAANNSTLEWRNEKRSEIDTLLENNATLAETCTQYDLLTSSLMEATGAYQHWLNAQNAADYGDMADDAVGAIKRIRDTFDESSDIFGDFGSKKFSAAVEFVVPESVDPKDIASIEAYMNDFKQYLKFDDNGKATDLNIDQFLQNAVNTGLMSYSEDEGFKVLGGKKMEDFAEGLNMSSGAVQAFFDELQLKGGEFDFLKEGTDGFADLSVKAYEAVEAIRKINGVDTNKINLDVSNFDDAQTKISELDTTIAEMQRVKTKLHVDASDVEKANSIIEYCVVQQQKLSLPAIMSVDASRVEGDLGRLIELLQQFQTERNNLEIQKKVGLDTSDAEAKLQSLANEIGKIPEESKKKITLSTTATSVSEIQKFIDNLSGEMIVNAGVNTSLVEAYQKDEKHAKGVMDWRNNSAAVDRYMSTLKVARGTVYWSNNISNVRTNFSATGNVTSGKSGRHNLNGTAHASGSWGTKVSEKALVGEVGREIICNPNTGKWYTVGDKGAEYVDVPAGSIIFNHKQTEDLLNNGYVSGRASALSGSSYAGGNTGTYVSGGYKKYVSTSSGSYSGSSNNSSSSSSSKSSSSSSSSASKEDELQKVDWIEIAIDRIERGIEKLKNVASSAFFVLSKRSDATADAISEINREIDVQQRAANRYLQEANSVGLSADLADKVRRGTININEYSKDTQELISQYQQWYEKSINCSKAVIELHENLASLYQDNFNNIKDDYSNRLSLLEYLSKTYENSMNKLEEKGRLGTIKYYQSLNDVQQKNIEIMKSEVAELTKSFNDAMASGEIDEYSEAWYSFTKDINDTKESIDEATISILKNQKAMRELEWSYFDYIQDRIGQITQESKFMIELMSNSKLYDDYGQFNNNGMASMGLRAENYNVYMVQADDYAKEILKANKDIANDPYNTDLIKHREDLIKLQQEAISNAESEKKAIVSLVKDGVELELKSLKKLIDARNDATQASKDLYDYQKKINEQTGDVAKIQKQLAAYENDTSEENKARVQKLQESLTEAQDKLAESEFDNYISESKKILDDLYDEYSDILNQRLDNVDSLVSDMITTTNANSDQICTTLENEANKVGYILADSTKSIWENGGSANSIVTQYGDNFSGQLTSVNQVLSGISANVSKLVNGSDEELSEAVSSSVSEPIVDVPSPAELADNAAKAINSTTNNSTTKFNDEIMKGVASAIWVYGIKAGWGNNQERVNKLTEKFGASGAASIQSYINAHVNDGELYNYWARNGRGNMSQYYYSAFKTGGLANYTGFAWLDGTPNKPEIVLNAQDSQNFMQLRDALRAMSQNAVTLNNSGYGIGSVGFNIADVSKIASAMSASNGNIGNNITFGDINIPIDHVENYEDFVNQLKQDRQFEDMIKSMTVDRLVGGSSLAKNKFRW